MTERSISHRFHTLPTGYTLDESDPDTLTLVRPDGSKVGSFISEGSSEESIRLAAEWDFDARPHRIAPYA